MVDIFVTTVLMAIIIVVSTPILIVTLVEKFNRHFGEWVCNEFGFHIPPDDPEFDGIGLRGKCPRCGMTILSDGCGGWIGIPEVDDS